MVQPLMHSRMHGRMHGRVHGRMHGRVHGRMHGRMCDRMHGRMRCLDIACPVRRVAMRAACRMAIQYFWVDPLPMGARVTTGITAGIAIATVHDYHIWRCAV
tara:strand:- start:1374 stop:1679 length:306 start_codon:yes stop_codon:yes gene_type:complete